MKNKKTIKQKLAETKDKLQEQAKNGDNSFSYWLGFRRALEWMLVTTRK